MTAVVPVQAPVQRAERPIRRIMGPRRPPGQPVQRASRLPFNATRGIDAHGVEALRGLVPVSCTTRQDRLPQKAAEGERREEGLPGEPRVVLTRAGFAGGRFRPRLCGNTPARS